MKKKIVKWLSIAVLAVMLVLLILNYYLQLNNAENNFASSAVATIDQMEAIVEQNDADLEKLTEDVKSEYIIRAQMAAYIIETIETEDICNDTPVDYKTLIELLDVDEIHLFDADGVIYDGSVAEYIGYSFDSGAQMAFFMPMLSDKTLVLCQDITPNTAEGKPMIYAAVWKSDGTGIVQIGLEPERLIEAQSQNELSYIFSNMPVSESTNLHAIDAETGVILGSTDETLVGQTDTIIREISSQSTKEDQSFYAVIDGVNSICVFRQVGDVYIGMTQDKSILNAEIWTNTLNSAIYIVFASVILIFTILGIIEYYVLKNIHRLIEEMNQISNGNLDVKLDIHDLPEFAELSEHVNSMVSSLLNMTVKLSSVLDKVDVKMAIYEYKSDMGRVLATANIGNLLDLFPAQTDLLLSNKNAFEERIAQIKTRKIEDAENIYDLDGRGEYFLKIESVEDGAGTYGVIMDMSEEISEWRKLAYERDYDVLTNVYNRRAFLSQLEQVVKKDPEHLQDDTAIEEYIAVIVLDMDNLKVINDAYGHAVGDDAIRECVRAMKAIETPNKIVARMGGDEFMIVLYGARKQSALERHIAALEQASQALYVTQDAQKIQVKMSAGYVFDLATKAEYAVLEKKADEALYRAKRSGKAQFIEY